MRKFYIWLFLFFMVSLAQSQSIGINENGTNPHTSSILDIQSVNKGFLIPRIPLLGTSDQTTIPSPATSLLVYNTSSVSDVVPGYYFFNGNKWAPFGVQHIAEAWNITGNSKTADGTNFIGTIDNVQLNFKINNQKSGIIDHIQNNTFLGYLSNENLSTSTSCVGIGDHALNMISTGSSNIAIGKSTLSSSIESSDNLAIGAFALTSNTYAQKNIAIGYNSMGLQSFSNTNASWNTFNTAIGHEALYNNNPMNIFSGRSNTAIGNQAGYHITSSYNNLAIGYQALYSNNTPTPNVGNTCIGNQSLFNTTGERNIALGHQALYSNVGGSTNTSLGGFSGYEMTSGNNNIMVGYNAGRKFISGDQNIRIGHQNCALPGGGNSSSNNIIIGAEAKCYQESGNNNVVLGYQADYRNVHGENNLIVGHQAGGGAGIHSKSGCVFIGYQAGYGETNSDKLYIENSSDIINPLIYGDFLAGRVGIETSNPIATLDVNGRVRLSKGSTVYTNSNHTTVARDLPGILSGGRLVVPFNVNFAPVSSCMVLVNPQNSLNGLIIEYTRVSALNTVEVSFFNPTGGVIDLANMNYYISVLNY